MKKALLRRKRRKPNRVKKKVKVIASKKESEKRGKYARSKVKQELISILEDEVRA